VYIFGEFSPDEINQFFVTPRFYVEVSKTGGFLNCASLSFLLPVGKLCRALHAQDT
uniref:Uncharacterized protein n=1 Tax=Poecilia reticulata TaxID=8081 RepID=A0A3P9QJG3_POERE